jgi:hypothetical protein
MSKQLEQARALVVAEREEAEDAVKRHETEVSDLVAKITELREIEARFGSLNGGAPAARPPSTDRGSSSQPARTSTRKPSAPARKSGDAAASKARQGRRDRQGDGRSSELMDKVLAFIRANPGRSGKEIEEGTGTSQGSVSRATIKLNRQGKIRTESGGQGKKKAYFATEAAALPADESGAKSEQERKIVEVLLEVDSPLPASELSVRTGIRSDHCPSMCEGLVRRHVITRIPPKASHLPVRYEALKRPKTMSDRAAA